MEDKNVPKLFEGGDVNVHYMLMPLTAEESNAGGEYLGARYAVENKDRWINVDHLIFELQTYDRGYTTVRIEGRTYGIYQDVLEGDLNVRLFIGRYIGTAREDIIGGIQTMDMTPKNLFTWEELIDSGVVTDAANLVIDYSKLIDKDKKCLIGNTVSGGVRLVIPPKTTNGDTIVDVSASGDEAAWAAINYPTRYICEVVLPEGLTSIGSSGAAFPMLGRNVIRHKVSVKIPSTVTAIGEKAFYGSRLEVLSGSKPYEFTGNDMLETIGESAFENCTELSVVHFGPKLKTVGKKAFANCKQAKLHFKNTITDVAEDACLLAGDIEYTPRIVKGDTVPDIVTKAPFGAKLWNGKVNYVPPFYTKPLSHPARGIPVILPEPEDEIDDDDENKEPEGPTTPPSEDPDTGESGGGVTGGDGGENTEEDGGSS